MQNNLLEQGLSLMIYGMGTVFVFLALLIVVTTLMSTIVQRFFKEEIPTPAETKSQGAYSVQDPRLVAIIKAAIDQHHKANQRNQ